MREVFATAAEWREEGRDFALATLVGLREAATAPLGTTVAVDAGGRIAGNIGAGCYEGDIVAACLKTLADGATRRLDINLGEDELLGGSACGAVMQVAVWRPPAEFLDTARAIAAGECETVLSIAYDDERGARVTFACTFVPKDALILVGATALAAELATIARRLDFNVFVVDPRPAFATPERVPDARLIRREWPDDCLPQMLSERTPIVMLSHDPKFDLPGLRCALRSNAPYVGLLGSRRSQQARRASLRDDGFDDAALARIRGPAGLDIGGSGLAETAISILGEIVATLHGREGAPLRAALGTIHSVAERVAGPA